MQGPSYDAAGDALDGPPQPGVHLSPTLSSPAAVRLAVTLAQTELLAAFAREPLAIVPDPWGVAGGGATSAVALSPSGQVLAQGSAGSVKAGQTP